MAKKTAKQLKAAAQLEKLNQGQFKSITQGSDRRC
jgi:hypothetical protein